ERLFHDLDMFTGEERGGALGHRLQEYPQCHGYVACLLRIRRIYTHVCERESVDSRHRFPAQTCNLIPPPLVYQIRFHHPAPATGDDIGFAYVGSEVVHADSTGWHEAERGEWTAQGIEHIHAAGCFGWKEFEHREAPSHGRLDFRRVVD